MCQTWTAAAQMGGLRVWSVRVPAACSEGITFRWTLQSCSVSCGFCGVHTAVSGKKAGGIWENLPGLWWQIKVLFSASQDCLNLVSHIGRLKQEEVISLQLWRLEVLDKGAHTLVPSGGSVPGLPRCLAEGCVTPASPHHFPWVCVCVQTFSFYKNSSHLGSGPFLMTPL